jgi:hypothetical protein
VAGSGSLHAFLEAEIHEAVRTSKDKRRPQEVRDVRNLEHLPRIAAGSEQGQSKRGNMAATRKATEVGPPKPTGARIMTPHVNDTRHTPTGFGVSPAGFWSGFGPIPPFCVPIPSFRNGNVYCLLCHCMLEVSSCL